MENYEKLCPVGEGTYGVVMKCRHKETGQIVAIKKFKEKEDDTQIRRTAIKEVKILRVNFTLLLLFIINIIYIVINSKKK